MAIVFIGGYFVWNYAFQYFMLSMAEQGIAAMEEKIGSSFQSPQQADRTMLDDPSVSSGNETSQNIRDPNQAGGSGQTGGSAVGIGTQPGSQSGSAPSPETTPIRDSSAGSLRYEANITPEKAKQVQQSITMKEKTKVTSILLKRLGSNDISKLIQLAGGGLTVQEKREAKKLLLERLTPEEYDELIIIAAKYGLSQGKKHQESKGK